MRNEGYRSALAPKIAAYVAERRSVGYKFEGSADVLLQLDRLAGDIGWESDSLGRELVEAFVSPRPGEAPRTRAIRASAARCFGAYLAARGEEAYVLPRGHSPASCQSAPPRLFTRDEIRRLLDAADSMPHTGRASIRHIVIPTMLKMVYACGLRISEATRLLLSDVDLAGGMLAVRATKFNKDRRVPMSPSLARLCREYAEDIHGFSRADSAFFPSSRGGAYWRGTVGEIFRRLLAVAGIPHYDDGPCLHSLRHSFAVHRIAQWAEEGVDVNAMLPHLSAYMGHEGLAGTERYLRLTMEMMPDLRSRIEASCSWMIPEVR